MTTKPGKIDIELFSRVENEPKGSFKIFHATRTGVAENIYQHQKNSDAIANKIRLAENAGCYIESISLRLQTIDYWLRLYFDDVAPSTALRKKEFGRFITQCKELGLSKDLADELSKANKQRVYAIHGFMIGSIDYSELRTVSEEFRNLMTRTICFILENSGKFVTSREELQASPGAVVVHILSFLEEVKSGYRY